MSGVLEIVLPAVSWNQTNNHHELAPFHSLAMHVIIFMKNEINANEVEEDLSEYVLNCENTFSREHTQWHAMKKSECLKLEVLLYKGLYKLLVLLI